MASQGLSNVDPVVRDDMAQAEARGAEATVPVVLVLHLPDGEPPGDLADMERRLEQAVGPVRARLTALGIAERGVMLPLAGGLALDLTPAQIRTLAGEPLVKRIVPNRQVRAIP